MKDDVPKTKQKKEKAPGGLDDAKAVEKLVGSTENTAGWKNRYDNRRKWRPSVGWPEA